MKSLPLLLSSALLSVSAATYAASPSEHQAFINEWQAKGVDSQVLQQALEQAKKQPKIIEAITRPWEAKPWYQYRQLFLTDARINQGVEFWEKNEAALAKASAQYGVPMEVITAIIGVETSYGRNMGSWKVLDALYTLGFYYPRRATFFRKELGHFIELSQEQGWPLTQPLGSYAGAMGLGQFIPSSYQAYAVDFDGDGKRDLFGNTEDAIGSVANYFAKHHWQPGKAVEQAVTVSNDEAVKSLLWTGKKLDTSAAQLRQAGVQLSNENSTHLSLLKLEVAENQWQYYVIHPNFYTITRYNRSPLYAMAVWQLSQELLAKKQRNSQ